MKRGAKVSYFDPLVPEFKLPNNAIFKSEKELAPGSFDVCLLLTIHDGMDLHTICQSASKIVDTRGVTRGLELDSKVTILGSGLTLS